MQKVVGVKFKSNGKVYLFDINNVNVAVDDDVIVDSALGLSYGKVSLIKTINENELNEPLKMVVRKATDKDKKKFLELEEKSKKDILVVKDKVKQLGLEMKIVSAEYCFDGSKILIEFAAEDRVDFRDLLKELASILKVRIELHQVGQRDEVKIKGGIGPCGEVCCCARFLKDFEHVTVKMAKNQGLSLNPTKISGLCGRLMCCLGYENSQYEEILKKMPKINSEIDSPKGRGFVVYNDILRERVSVKIKQNDDSFIVYDFSIPELNGEVVNEIKDEEEIKEDNKQEPNIVKAENKEEKEIQNNNQQDKKENKKENNKDSNQNKSNNFKRNKFKNKNHKTFKKKENK